MLFKSLIQNKFSFKALRGDDLGTYRQSLFADRRKLKDRRSSVKPNQSGLSRRVNFVDRRKNWK